MKGMNTMSSFTVQNDLLSESSSSNMQFTNRFGEFKPIKVPSRRIQQLQQKARTHAYREQNDKLFNPFQHRLAKGFGSSEEDIFFKEKQRVQEQIRKQQEDKINQSRNYTIVFENARSSNPKGNVFKVAANHLLGKQTIPEQGEDDEIIYKPEKKVIPKSIMKPVGQKNSRTSLQPGSRQSLKSPIHKSSTPQTYSRAKPLPKPPLPKSSYSYTNKNTTPANNSTNKNSSNRNTNTNKPQTVKKNSENKQPKYSESYEGPDINLVLQLQREILENPTVEFSDIAELDTAKELLRQAVLLPKLMPDFFKGIRRATKGILLFGPPGTGKTMLAKAISKGNVFFNVSASSLASKWRGQSQKLVRILFQMAKFYAPSVIFFDEIDALGSKRTEDDGEANRKVKTELLVQMDGVGSESSKNVLVLAATNRPWDLDEALRRRLQKRIYIALPSESGRQEMLKLCLKQIKTEQGINFKQIAKLTKDYSGADLAIVCRQAAYMPMRRKLESLGGLSRIQQIVNLESEMDAPVTQKDLLNAIKNVNKSVGSNDLKRYATWMKEFGSS